MARLTDMIGGNASDDVLSSYLREGIAGRELEGQSEYEGLPQPSPIDSIANRGVLSRGVLNAIASLATSGATRAIGGYHMLGELPSLSQVYDPVTLASKPFGSLTRTIGKSLIAPGMRSLPAKTGSILGGLFGGMTMGPLGAMGVGVLGNVGGEALADLFNMREDEDILDWEEDRWGWWDTHKFREQMRDPEVRAYMEEMHRTLTEPFLTREYEYQELDFGDVDPSLGGFDFGDYGDVMGRDNDFGYEGPSAGPGGYTDLGGTTSDAGGYTDLGGELDSIGGFDFGDFDDDDDFGDFGDFGGGDGGFGGGGFGGGGGMAGPGAGEGHY